jgi:phospholipid transport system substrate-binding protein
MTSKLVMLLCAVVLVPFADPGYAAVSDAAETPVETLMSSLLESMRAGTGLSMSERYRKLEPVIEQVFAMPLLTRLAVGPDWVTFSPNEQQATIAAFTRFTVANYAHNFRHFDGERFQMDAVVSRGDDKIVRTQLILTHDTPVSLLYRMHEVQGGWKIIDVYADGVSALALRRSDFAAAIASGGAAALIAHLNKASDDLIKS